jgi:hypothetical protein
METLFPDDWLKIAGSAMFFTSLGSAFARSRVRLPTTKGFWKKEEAAGTLVTSTDLCDEPWPLWIQSEKLSSNVKGNMYNFIHDPEEAKMWGLGDLLDNEDVDVPSRRQAAKNYNIP